MINTYFLTICYKFVRIKGKNVTLNQQFDNINSVFQCSIGEVLSVSSGSLSLEGRLNLLFCNNSFEDGGGLTAIVGAKSLGSLALSDTLRVTISISCILLCKILAMRSGMNS